MWPMEGIVQSTLSESGTVYFVIPDKERQNLALKNLTVEESSQKCNNEGLHSISWEHRERVPPPPGNVREVTLS